MIFEILVTTLLTIVIGLNTWSLKTLLRQDREITQLSQQVWGKDGRNGHSSDIRGFRRALEEIGDTLTDFEFRMRRVEDRLHIDTPTAKHPRFRSPKDDDAEDDRSG